jgi:hypothetical protein
MPVPTLIPTSSPPSTAQLLRLVATHDPDRLIAVGLTLQYFTEPLRGAMAIDAAQLHRVTTVLSKQIDAELRRGGAMSGVHGLVTDPDRRVANDHRTVSEMCGRAGWEAVSTATRARIALAERDAAAYGETAILRLASTRAAMPDRPWWGTLQWIEAVERWAASRRGSSSLVTALHGAPESVDADTLDSVLSGE